MSGPKPPSSNASARQSTGRVRIIAGDWRGRFIEFIDADGLRPSGNRIRETVFNWLQFELPGAHCLDLYAGSGVLGLEALSRGAASVTLVEKNQQVVRQLVRQVEKLGTDKANIVNQAAEDFLQDSGTAPATVPRYSLVFIDPPFADNAQGAIMQQLESAGILDPDATIYIEGPTSMALPADIMAGFTVHRSGKAGQVRYLLLRKRQ